MRDSLFKPALNSCPAANPSRCWWWKKRSRQFNFQPISKPRAVGRAQQTFAANRTRTGLRGIGGKLNSRASKTVVGLAQEFDVFDIRRNLIGGQRRLRVRLGVAVEAEQLRVNLAPEIGVVAFPAAQVLDDQRFGSDTRPQPVEPPGIRTSAPQSTSWSRRWPSQSGFSASTRGWFVPT